MGPTKLTSVSSRHSGLGPLTCAASRLLRSACAAPTNPSCTAPSPITRARCLDDRSLHARFFMVPLLRMSGVREMRSSGRADVVDVVFDVVQEVDSQGADGEC